MAKPYFTQEEREAYREKQHREAEQRIEKLATSWQDDPKQVAEYFQFASRFHQYSERNRMLIYTQNPTASFVASFKDFKEMGYFVRKGERGMKIVTPAPATFWRMTPQHPWHRLKDATDEIKHQVKVGMLESRERMYFHVGTVFDITQTNCPIEDYPKLLGLGYNDEQHAAIYRELSDYSGTLGMPVTEKPLEIGLRGLFYHNDHHIEVNSVLGDTQKLSTLLHEMSHGIMEHDTAPDFSVALKELEADALSIMLEDRFGIEITEARQRHLAEHFEAYMSELSEKGLEFDPAQTFKRVHERYEKCETAMAQYLRERGILPTQNPVPLTAEAETGYPPTPLQSDHYYVDLDARKLEWLYYEPEADHFVSTVVYDPDFEDALQVAAEGGGTPWDALETQGKQYIFDRGTEDYTWAWQRMKSEAPVARYQTRGNFEKLQGLFETDPMERVVQHGQQPDRVERLVGASPNPERISGEEFDERWEQGQREFRNVEFYEINMPARMNGTFEDCSFLKCDFTASDVSATFKNCAVYEPKTTAAIFKGTSFDGCKIGWASFRGTVFEDVTFRNTDFQKCNAMRTRFSDVRFDGGTMDRFHFYNEIAAERVSGLDSVKIGISGETEKLSKKHAEKIRETLSPSYAFSVRELDAYAAEQKPTVSSEEYTCAVRWMADANRDQLPDTVPTFVAGNPPAEDTYKLAAAIARANDPDLPPELQQAEASGITYTLLKRHGIPVASPTFNGGKLDLQTQGKLLQRIRSGTGYLQIQVNGTIQPSQTQQQAPTSQAVAQTPSVAQPIAPPIDPAE